MVRTPFPGLPALSSEPRRGFILHGGPLVVIHCMRSSRVAAQLGELVGCSWLSQTGPAALPATDPQRQKSGFGTPHRTARAFSRTPLGLISTGCHALNGSTRIAAAQLGEVWASFSFCQSAPVAGPAAHPKRPKMGFRLPRPGPPALSSQAPRGFILHGGPLVVMWCPWETCDSLQHRLLKN